MRTIDGFRRSLWMADLDPIPDRLCARLHQQITLSILVDDLVVAALGPAVAAMREQGWPEAEEFERVIRSHRIAVLKQGAILGAAGINM